MSDLKASVKFIDKNKSEFYSVLKNKVDQYFIDNKITKYANSSMVLKTIILLSAYIFPFIFILVFQPSFGIAYCYGV